MNSSILLEQNPNIEPNVVESLCLEVKRVLKPGGLYVFVEHVAAKGIVNNRYNTIVYNHVRNSGY